MAYWLIVQRCTLTYWENNAKTKMDPRQYNLLVVRSTLYDTKIATHQTTNTIHWVGEGTFINWLSNSNRHQLAHIPLLWLLEVESVVMNKTSRQTISVVVTQAACCAAYCLACKVLATRIFVRTCPPYTTGIFCPPCSLDLSTDPWSPHVDVPVPITHLDTYTYYT